MIIPRPPEPVTQAEEVELELCAADAVNEAICARKKYPRFASLHEAESVLREEAKELSDELLAVHGKENPNLECVVAEALQVAAMALRIVAEVRGTF